MEVFQVLIPNWDHYFSQATGIGDGDRDRGAHVIFVSAPVQIIGFLVFYTWSELRVRICCLSGQGIEDLNSGLTIVKLS